MTYARWLAPIATASLLACSAGTEDEDAGATLLDAGDVDSGRDVDAGKEDAGASDLDAGRVDSGTVQCGCMTDTLRWELDGGFRAYDTSDEIQACRTFVYTRTTFGGGGTTEMCTNEMPCSGDAVTIDELLLALEDPDVVAAFAAAPILYGRDERAVDGPLFVITLGGRSVSVGFACMGASGCIEIPPGVAALQELLVTIEGERLEVEDCASMF